MGVHVNMSDAACEACARQLRFEILQKLQKLDLKVSEEFRKLELAHKMEISRREAEELDRRLRFRTVCDVVIWFVLTCALALVWQLQSR